MFSTVVVYGIFIIASLLWVAIIADETVNHKFNSLQRRLGIRETDWFKVFVLFAVWAASGVYLFG